MFLRGISRRMVATLWASAAVYAGALALFLNTNDAAIGSSTDRVAVFAFALMGIGAVQAVCTAPSIARSVAGPGSSTEEDVLAKIREQELVDIAYNPAIRLEIRQRERRQQAREIIAQDPELAARLRIGRPDLDREYVDGGLIDVNHVPTWVFASLPGIDVDAAERIVSARERLDGLQSPADLVVLANVPSEVVDALADVLIFRHEGD